MLHKNYDFVFSYLKQLLEEHKSLISEKQYAVGYKTILIFEEWNKERKLSAEDLYCVPSLGMMIDECEEFEDSILFYAEEMKYNEKEDNIQQMWLALFCILVSFIAIAFHENAICPPSDIEGINIDKLDDFFLLTQEPSITPTKLFDYFNVIVCY